MKAGWKERTVGEVLRLEYGKPLDAADRKPGGRYPVYGANGEKDRTDKFYFGKPSIIVGRKGSAGEINLTEPKFWPLDVTYFVTFDERQHDLRFLYYLLTTLDLPSLAKGVKPGINRNEVYSQVIEVPPLPEQERIVGILDEAFDGIATAKANAEKNLQNARALFESHLESVFSKRGDGWMERPLGEVCETTQGVQIPKSLHFKTPSVNRRRYLYISDFEQNENLKYVEDIYPKKKVSETDLIVVNTGATAGKIFRGIDGVLSNNLFRVSLNPKEVNGDFLYYFVTSSLFKEHQKKNVRGTANPHMGHENFKSTPIRIPSLDVQLDTVESLNALREETQRLEAVYQRKLAVLEELKKSLLHQAFSGQL